MTKACVPGLGSSVSRGVVLPDKRTNFEKWPPRALLHPVVIARRLKITVIMPSRGDPAGFEDGHKC